MTTLKLFNTLTRKTEEFRPISQGAVKIYTCGPTVYSAPHVGNFASYVYWDLLVATLELDGYSVRRVLNLTDVGHLTSDADDGEDKLEKGARVAGTTVWEVADHFIQLFQADFNALRLRQPAVWARATDYISADEALVETLIAKGYTYETKDGVYYDTSKFPRYAEFARLDLAGLKAGARVELSSEKHNPSDFAVWKFIQPGEKHAMRWDFLGRPGYPGWHLECSTIIHAELGETIDIHTGGIDHIPVHHTNEIAQSESAFDRPLAKYWLHCNFLTVQGQKISKSLGNIYTIEELVEQGFDSLDFKMWVLQGHYQSERDFSLENLAAARTRRLAWKNRAALAWQQGDSDQRDLIMRRADNSITGFHAIQQALNENLNSPAAFAAIDANEDADIAFWQQVEQTFRLGLLDGFDTIATDPEVQQLLSKRAAARATKDWTESDRLRALLLSKYGLSLLDTPTGQIWQFADQ